MSLILAEGAKEINLFNETYPVRAEVVQIHGFSAHADRTELLNLLTPVKEECERVCLVHGEPDQRLALAQALRDLGFPQVELPSPGQRLTL